MQNVEWVIPLRLLRLLEHLAEQGERSYETEKDNAWEGEHKSRGSVLVEGNCLTVI